MHVVSVLHRSAAVASAATAVGVLVCTTGVVAEGVGGHTRCCAVVAVAAGGAHLDLRRGTVPLPLCVRAHSPGAVAPQLDPRGACRLSDTVQSDRPL